MGRPGYTRRRVCVHFLQLHAAGSGKSGANRALVRLGLGAGLHRRRAEPYRGAVWLYRSRCHLVRSQSGQRRARACHFCAGSGVVSGVCSASLYLCSRPPIHRPGTCRRHPRRVPATEGIHRQCSPVQGHCALPDRPHALHRWLGHYLHLRRGVRGGDLQYGLHGSAAIRHRVERHRRPGRSGLRLGG